MKKAILFILATGLFATLITADEYDIRKLKWGMPLDEVRKIENLTDTLYKDEILLESKTEVVFGLGTEGLEYVIYSTKDMTFLGRVTELLNRKYGKSTNILDYTFLLDAEKIMKANPEAILMAVEDDDFSGFFSIEKQKRGQGTAQALKAGLKKRKFWKKGNTAILLLDNIHEVYLSYRPLEIHEASKVKFKKIMKELKSMLNRREETKKKEVESNF